MFVKNTDAEPDVCQRSLCQYAGNGIGKGREKDRSLPENAPQYRFVPYPDGRGFHDDIKVLADLIRFPKIILPHKA